MHLCEVQVQAGGKDTNSIVIGYHIRVFYKHTTLLIKPILPPEALLRENTKIQ